MKKVIKFISNSVLIIFALLAVAVIYIVFQSKGDIEKAPSVFGYKPLTILSNSMQPEFSSGDIILITDKEKPNVGDVVTYKHPDGILVTHRVIQKSEENGKTIYEAKGDNNNVQDNIKISESDILGVQKIIIPNAGFVAKFVAGPIGFFLLVAIPILMLIIIEIFQRLGLIGKKVKKEQTT